MTDADHAPRSTLSEAFSRLPELVAAAVDGLTPEQLRRAPAPGANPIGWLIWHLTRVQDHHVAELMGTDQVWISGSWAADVGLDPDPDNHGYGHTPEDVDRLRPASADVLTGYYRAVSERTEAFVAGLSDDDLATVVDTRWDPPVTMRVRLISVLADDLQHVGQAAYVRGLIASS